MNYEYRGLRKSVHDAEPLRATLARRLDLPEVDEVVVEHQAIDARRKPAVEYVYNVRFRVARPTGRLQQLLSEGRVAPYRPPELPAVEPRIALPREPVIVGSGPAGLFAALYLARKGYRPLVLERGDPVGPRTRAVQRLWDEAILDPESNMQFGEGGAGTFSDGKLTTGKSSALDELVLADLIHAGAPETIRYSHRPHVGTDHLRRVACNLRREIESLGGSMRFRSKVTDVLLQDGAVAGLSVTGERLSTRAAILAIGHSARDTLAMLSDRGVAMEPKAYAVGTRIEHPAAFIDESQYGREAAAVLPAADYHLTYRRGDLAAFTFCMCPGGQVVCASSEPEGQVTNGMSRYAREGAYSNSALVVGVDPERLGITRPLDAVGWQRALEHGAYRAGGGGFRAVAQHAADFLDGRASERVPETTYRPGVVPGDVSTFLPDVVVAAVRGALARFDRLMPGFAAQGVLIGLESRTSSPVRILRDRDYCSVSTPGLFLLGEGAGYAGGIMTCARDAVRFCRLVRDCE